MSDVPGILLTAFDPSADALAASLVMHLRRRRPAMPIWAMGGPKMQQAGAQLLESSTDHAVMLAAAATQYWRHRKRLAQLRSWLSEHQIAAVVPVDSPAANWSICKLIRRYQPEARIVHLVAPQLWAWAPWRINKLRRLTDHVLCLLPFESDWFDKRGVRSTFVGHPLYDPKPTDTAMINNELPFPQGAGPKLAMFPGSRLAEVKANWPCMLTTLATLRKRYADLHTVVATYNQRTAEQVVKMTQRNDPSQLDAFQIEMSNADAVLSWADAALVVSGTATLHAAAHRVPMVMLYHVNRLSWHLVGRWIVRTQTFSLPNLVVQDEGLGGVVPEFVPHFGQIEAVIRELEPLLTDGPARSLQKQGFDRIARRFAGVHFAEIATEQLLDEIDGLNNDAARGL